MIRDLITPGLGFTPGSVEYIITRGLDIGAAVLIPTVYLDVMLRNDSLIAANLRNDSLISVNLDGDSTV